MHELLRILAMAGMIAGGTCLILLVVTLIFWLTGDR